jgi:hypothetical protein
MTDQHRATPEQWDYMHERTEAGLEMTSCILELRNRIEALEAAQQDKLDRLIALDAADPTPDPAMTELRAASAEARSGGLVERVEEAIANEDWMNNGLDESVCGDDDPTYRYTSAACNSGHSFQTLQSRAAIREVATWLDRFALHGSGEYAQAARVLRQEVGQ